MNLMLHLNVSCLIFWSTIFIVMHNGMTSGQLLVFHTLSRCIRTHTHTHHVRFNSLLWVVSQVDGLVHVVLSGGSHQLREAQGVELGCSDPGGQRFQGQRQHGRARPEHVHPRGVPVAEGRVQTQVCQPPPPDVFFLGGHGGEDDLAHGQAQLGGGLHDVGFPDGRELEQPQNAVLHTLEYVDPALQRCGVDLVQLVEVAEDDGSFR